MPFALNDTGDYADHYSIFRQIKLSPKPVAVTRLLPTLKINLPGFSGDLANSDRPPWPGALAADSITPHTRLEGSFRSAQTADDY